MTNDKYRRKKLSQHHRAWLFSNSLNLIHIGGVQICSTLICKPVFPKNEPIILCLTYFYFHRAVLSKKYLERFDGKSVVKTCHQNWSQTKKNFGYNKVTSAVLISYFRGLLVIIFRRIKWNEEYQVKYCCLFKLTLY